MNFLNVSGSTEFENTRIWGEVIPKDIQQDELRRENKQSGVLCTSMV